MNVKCEVCDKIIERSNAEIKRNKNKGRRTFCSRQCQGKVNVKNFGDKVNTDTSQLKKGSKRDEYSKFRFFLKVSKMHIDKRKDKRSHNITLQDLKEQWEKQKGICPYTGWTLITSETLKERVSKTPNRASLDRIDSTKGYEKDNIQFVSLISQYAKNGWSEDVLLEFAKAIVEKKKTTPN